MSKARPGAPYTVVSGDTLNDIAKQAYGDGRRWREIWRANSTVLKSGDPSLVFPGERITIPLNAVVEAAAINLLGGDLPTLSGKDLDDFTIVVNDQEIPSISGRCLRTADTPADGFTSVIRFDPDEVELNEALRPYSYAEASCYLGGVLKVKGVLYILEPDKNGNTRTAILQAFSPTVDVIDSTAKAPLESKNITLEQRARELVEPLGVKVVFEVDDDERFKRVTIGPTEKIHDHLDKLALQRGILITSTELGEYKFTRPGGGTPIAVLEEDSALVQGFTTRFDGRQRFNQYTALGQTPGRKRRSKRGSKTAIAKDDNVPRSRATTFNTDETTAGGMKIAAEWRRSKQLADALTIPLRVSTWYTPDGELWSENKLVTVKAKSIYVPTGFDFLIRSTDFIFQEKGTPAILNVIPPQAFTGEQLDEPWAPDELRRRNQIDRVTAAAI